MRHRWLAGAAFVLKTFATDLHGFTRIKQDLSNQDGSKLFVKDRFSRGFHSILPGLHSFSTIHLALRFVFAYPSGEIRPQCCTKSWRPLITTSALFRRT